MDGVTGQAMVGNTNPLDVLKSQLLYSRAPTNLNPR
jgi:hypothetical protein